MPDYKSLYYNLFNNVSDTIERLKQAQQEAERRYTNEETPALVIVPPEQDEA